MSCNNMNRRQFVSLTATLAGGFLGLGVSSFSDSKAQDWDPDKPFSITGKKLTVQPVLMYRTPERREESSWKSWGGVQTEQAAAEEAQRISKELNELSGAANFPLQILPIIKVKSAQVRSLSC